MYINMKPYMESQMTSHLTLSNLEVKGLVYCKESELDHMLVLNINTKAYMGSTLMQLHLTSVTLRVNYKVIQILKVYIIKELIKPYVTTIKH